MNVINFNSDKVTVNIEAGIVTKKSSKDELGRLVLASDYLTLCPIILPCGMLVKVPEILNYESDKLTTKFCGGKNVEHLLMNQQSRREWVETCNQLMNIFRFRGFLWGDIAPRNIIFDRKNNILYIFDFERSLLIKDKTINKKSFSSFFRRYSYEEFSCVLPIKEQEYFFHDLLIDEKESISKINEINSRRKRLILKKCFGKKSQYTNFEMQIIERLMSAAVTPFNGIYPIFFIDEIIKKRGLNEYSKIAKWAAYRMGWQEIPGLKDIMERL